MKITQLENNTFLFGEKLWVCPGEQCKSQIDNIL